MNATPPEEPPQALPTGTVTFVFTDIEGSTARWERHPIEMERVVRLHDRSMRAALAAHGGHVFKTVGDAFCAAFTRAADAIAAALAAQRALAAEDFASVGGLQVRITIHTGASDERDHDYFGPALNRVARLIGIGHGGQVLVSGATNQLVLADLPSGATLRDLGEHRLRDLARPERVYQLLAPGLIAEFPRLRSLDVLPNNLPLQLTSFVGRKPEIAEITGLLARHRLVTLVGSGGVGKTRISLQVAANLFDGYADGVWFIELAPLASGDYIPSTIVQALGTTLSPEGDPLKTLVRILNGRHALLVFDNCEHLLEHAARVISAVLHDCPHTNVLPTSRQGLGITGEATYRVPSLGLPTESLGADLTAARSNAYEAMTLFAERAHAVSTRFTLTDGNAPAIADICRRLDGIPLAIELAATRVPMLSPHQLRDRLDERFRLLANGRRDALPRQQTLRALIDWSHDLLTTGERALFRHLGIFVNGFSLDAAIAVGSSEGVGELDVFDTLASLVDKSLVLAESDGDQLRYRLLESTRAYALERLAAASDRPTVAGRHLRYFHDRFAELSHQNERTGRQTESNEALARELEDVRFALDTALACADIIEGSELLSYIDEHWTGLGLDAEGIVRLGRYTASLPALESRLLARLLIASAFLLRQAGQKTRALEAATEALAYARASCDSQTLAKVLAEYARIAAFLRRFDDAERTLAEAEALAGASARLRLDLLNARALFHSLRGDLALAARMFERLYEENRSLDNTRGTLTAAGNLADIHHGLGETERAIAIVHEILPTLRSGKDKAILAIMLHNLAGYLVAADDLPGAVAAAHDAIGIFASREPDHAFIGISIEHLALAEALRGHCSRAATLEGYATALFRRHGFEREHTETTTHNRLTALLSRSLAPKRVACAHCRGRGARAGSCDRPRTRGSINERRSQDRSTHVTDQNHASERARPVFPSRLARRSQSDVHTVVERGHGVRPQAREARRVNEDILRIGEDDERRRIADCPRDCCEFGFAPPHVARRLVLCQSPSRIVPIGRL